VGVAIFLYAWIVQVGLGLLRAWGFDSLGCFIPLGIVALLAFVWWLFLSSLGLLALFRKWATVDFRPECATVGQLVRGLARSEGEEAEEGSPWTGETVWVALRQLLAEQASLRPLGIARDTPLRGLLERPAPGNGPRHEGVRT
jgi:hypothetical protein